MKKLFSIILSIFILCTPAYAKDYDECKQFRSGILYISPHLDAQHVENNICDYMRLPVDFREALANAGIKVYSFSESEAGNIGNVAGRTQEFVTPYLCDDGFYRYRQETYAEIYNVESMKLHDTALLHEIGHCFDDTYAGGFPCTGSYNALTACQEWHDICDEEFYNLVRLNRTTRANCYNYQEIFAEAFAATMSKPVAVSKNCPKTYSFIIRAMSNYILYYNQSY